MEHIVKILLFLHMFSVKIYANSTISDPDTTNLLLMKYYGESLEDFVAKRLSGTYSDNTKVENDWFIVLIFTDTKFCASILLPTENTLKKSLDATFLNGKKGTNSEEGDHVDSCCRSLHKCDAHKHSELNYTNEWNIRHCECVYVFRACLKNLNTSLSNRLLFIHSINATKCYAKDYPIVKCAKLEAYLEPIIGVLKFTSSSEILNRCSRYELDISQPRKLQLFDLRFNYDLVSTIEGIFIIE